MFLKTPQHPVHYVFGCVTHAPTVFQAWALEDFEYKMRWLLLYTLAMGLATGLAISSSLGVFVSASVLVVTGFMGLPSFMGSKGQGGFLIRFSESYANAILAWHGFFVAFYLYMMMFGLTLMMLHQPWTKDTATVFFAGVSMLYLAFSLQLAAVTTKGVPQWVVPFCSGISGVGMYTFMRLSAGAS